MRSHLEGHFIHQLNESHFQHDFHHASLLHYSTFFVWTLQRRAAGTN